MTDENSENILYNLVGIIKLSLTFQDQNTIDVLNSRLCLFFPYRFNGEVVSLSKFLKRYVETRTQSVIT